MALDTHLAPFVRAQPVFDWIATVKTAIGVSALVLTYYGFWRIRGEYLRCVNNADLLYLVALYRDLTTHAYSLRGWSLTPAPYFVPDMPFFFLASAVTRDIPAAFTLYAAITFTSILGCLYWIARRVTSSRADRLLAVGLVSLLIFLPCLPEKSHYAYLMRWLLVPTGHGGGMLMGMVLLELGLQLQEHITVRRAIIFVVAAFGAVLSDRLTLTEFLAPLVAGALLVLMLRRRWTPLFGLVIVATSTYLSAIAAQAIIKWSGTHGPFKIPETLPRDDAREQLAHSWSIFTANWKEIAGPSSALFILMVLSCLVATIVAILEWRERRRVGSRRQRAGTGIIIFIVLASWALAVVVPVRMGIWVRVGNFRYALGLLVWPALLLTMAGAWAAHRAPPRWSVALAAAALALGLVFWRPVLQENPVHSSQFFYAPPVRFVDRVVRKYRLHNGYAGYWTARPITLSSKTGVMLGALDDPEQPPPFWIDNPNHWCQVPGGPAGAYPVYDFALCPSVDELKLLAQCGPPAFVEVDQTLGLRVLIYNRPSDVAFRNLGRTAAFHAAHLEPPRDFVKSKGLNSILTRRVGSDQ